ncbi:helix-turn-helix transcriptional regulator [Catenulispora rubra]|uniref:helix-turn-helix transcriptional regulator n=1 Tax=Catenulispora rubra TaxID=280293 RepID=UPI001891F3F8|nr:helix-turn-helix domain-containing protein [Catenulispora rubra]
MEADERRKWTLLTSHGHVLVEIARNPRARVRDISAVIGITERATQAIIADLERAGYVERVRMGRRTHYVIHPDNPFRHSAQGGLQVGPFLDLLTGELTGEVEPAMPTPQESFLAAAVLPLDTAAVRTEPVAPLLATTELAAGPAVGLAAGLAAGPAPAMEPSMELRMDPNVPGAEPPDPGTP